MHGVNLIGCFDKSIGLSESSRLIAETLQIANIPLSLISFNHGTNYFDQSDFSIPIENKFKYPINLFTIDSSFITAFVQKNGWEPFKYRYNIGLIFWETNQVTSQYHAGWKHLNEIWTTSQFMTTILSRIAPAPVHHFPQPIELKYTENKRDKNKHFTFLFYFSFASALKRKNPQAIIDAFKTAFPDQENVRLIIKSKEGPSFYKQLQMMQQSVQGDSRITWIEQTMSGQERFDLMNQCDCYISLHRSEGFGLTLAEAMLLNKPVIATGYSGNLDFMNEENSYLCSYSLVPIGKGNMPYPPQGLWAEPNIQHAASLMRRVVEHPEEAKEKAFKAKDFIQTHHSFKQAGTLMARRLAAIQLPTQPNIKPRIPFKVLCIYQIKKTLRPVKHALKRWLHKIRTYLGNS